MLNLAIIKLSKSILAASVFVTGFSWAQLEYEEKVIQSLEQIQHADIDSSIKDLNDIIKQYPNSKVGHLMLADLLATRAGKANRIKEIGSGDLQLNGLRDEIRYRWQNSKADTPAHQGKSPSNFISPSPQHRFLLAVDASNARLYIYENSAGDLTLIDDFYMTVGKYGMGKNLEGDLRTPVGVYHVTDYLPGDELPDRYGPGAFPINYPNTLDKLKNRTGYGIWIHGTESDNYNRVPLASDGCVSLSNDEFIEISQYVKTDGTTPVVIAEQFNWVSNDQLKESRAFFFDLVETWINDWVSLKHEDYIRHYSDSDFKSGEHNYASWSKHKNQVNSRKQFIELELDNLSIYSYPGEQDMVMISFRQHYKSDNFENISNKTLFWKKHADNQWRIVYEG